MVVTIDKIKNVVCSLNDNRPPVYYLDNQTIISKLWGNLNDSTKEKSIFNDFIFLI